MGSLIFQIPEDSMVMSQLTEAVPDWGRVGWIGGCLIPTQAMIQNGQVAKDTGFKLSRFISDHLLKGRYDPKAGGDLPCDWCEMLVERKLPAFVIFHQVGYSGSLISFSDAKQITKGFLNLGYRGALNFYSADYDNHEFENPERCRLHLERWRGYKCQEKGHAEHHPLISLEWNVEYGGKREELEPIVSFCRSLGLAELDPALVC